MSTQLIYVGTHAIKPGMLDTAKSAARELVSHVEANHPRMKHLEIDIDDDAHEMVVVQVHSDEASLFTHLEVAGEKIRAAYSFLERTTKIEIFGEPSEKLTTLIKQMGGDAPVRFNSAVAKFSRID